MGIPFATRLFGPRTNPDAVELALDLSVDAVTVYERTSREGWKKFASAQLDDPEFQIVIGLLRAEAESHAGGPRPARLWLPGEQVLTQRARIDGTSLAARWRAAIDYIDRQTNYRPDDVAVAVSPPDETGETTLLITFAETWREARSYAARWGFTPGEVSTRHHAGDFGPDGPVFYLHAPPPEPTAPARRNRLAVVAMAVTAIAAGAAVWALRPSEAPYSPPDLATGPAADLATGPVPEVAEVSPADQPPGLGTAGPMTAPEPKIRAESAPPKYFPRVPNLAPPDGTGRTPAIGLALIGFEFPASPNALTAPAAAGIAPRPLPVAQPPPPERGSVAEWSDPMPQRQPGDLSSPLAAKETPAERTEPTLRVETAALVSIGRIPPRRPWPAPAAEPPPPDPLAQEKDVAVASESAVAPLDGPVPAPRVARADPADAGIDTPEQQSLAMVLPPPRPARQGQPAAKTEATPPPAAPAITAPPAETKVPSAAAPTQFASLSAPLPRVRPAPSALPRTLPSIAALPSVTGATQPSIRAASTEQGLPLDSTALIGILNLDEGRKALLRFANGRYRSVVVGDELGGWRVSLIGVDAMRVTRSGEDRTLLLVNR